MFNQFDATMKSLLRASPASWLRLSGVAPTETLLLEDKDLHLEDTDLTTVTTTCDKVLRTFTPFEALHHFEFESDGKNVPKRVVRYSILLHYQFGLPVYTTVFLLRKEANRSDITGKYQLFTPDGKLYLDFAYNVVRVWELPVEAILNGDIGILPMAPLTNLQNRELSEVIQEMQIRAEAELDSEGQDIFWTAALLLLGLNFSNEFALDLLKEKKHMTNSTTYMGIINEGKEIGIVIGAEIGAEKTLKETILRQGTKRFGTPSLNLVDRLNSLHSHDVLIALSDRVIEVETWQEMQDYLDAVQKEV